MHILRLVLLVLAALAAIVGGVALLQRAIRPDTSGSLIAAALRNEGARSPTAYEITAAQHVLEEQLKATPEYTPFFDRLKNTFPSEYESFLAAFAKRLAIRDEIGNTDVLMAQAVHSLRLSRGILAAKASNSALEHIFELQAAMLRALATTDPHLCVDFLNGAEGSGFFEFSEQNRALVAAMGIAGVDAIHDGEVEQVERPPPSEMDFEALETALRGRGLDTPEIEALLDGKMSNPPIPDAKMCRAGQVYLETLAALPEASRLRIYGFAVELMARS